MIGRRLWLVAGLTLALSISSVAVVRAQDSIVEQIGCDLTNSSGDVVTVDNPCQVNDFINLFVYLSKWGLSILAVLGVLMLVYGGFQFVTAGGRPSKVDEGKRVILGTIVGSMITLTAYVIINTTVAAISGTTINNLNPFGPIASVFQGKTQSVEIQGQTKSVKLTRPFSGTPETSGNGTAVKACRTSTSWDHDCSPDQLMSNCADPEKGGGRSSVTNEQTNLNAKNCGCGEVDGCFGAATTKCVRLFQLANLLPPTGVIDRKTRDLIDSGGGKSCDYVNPPTATSALQDARAVDALLPDPQYSNAENNDLGCCIVGDGTNSLYCADSMSSRGCAALGANNTFLSAGSNALSGKCASIPAAAGRCGLCSNTNPRLRVPANKCFENATRYWCTTKAQSDITAGQPLYYFSGTCAEGQCGNCHNTLIQKP